MVTATSRSLEIQVFGLDRRAGGCGVHCAIDELVQLLTLKGGRKNGFVVKPLDGFDTRPPGGPAPRVGLAPFE